MGTARRAVLQLVVIAVAVGFAAPAAQADDPTAPTCDTRTSPLVPSIGTTLDSLVSGFTSERYGPALLDSMKAVAIGFAIAAALGLVVGVVLGRSRFLGAVFDPVITGLFAVPRIILYPVILVAVGVGLEAKVWLVVVSAFFPIALNTIAGVRNVSPTLIKLGRSLGCSRLQLARKVYLAAAAPTVMVGVRLGFSVAFISVTIAELFAAASGLGLLVQKAYGLQQYADMFAVVLLITSIALAGNVLLWVVERRVRGAVE